MTLLERCLVSSPANFHIKILLVRIYLEAGLIVAADYIFTSLDVKHIQLDSLGHLHAPLLAPLGFSLASTILSHSTKFFITNCKDVCIILRISYANTIPLNLIYSFAVQPECRSSNVCL